MPSGAIASETFASAPKLRQFLSFVVEEALAGRGSDLKGKTIAVDVYGRDVSDVEAGQNLVRVEARRLRRRLHQYFTGPGADEPWRILIDLGGYSPRFERGAGKESVDFAETEPKPGSPYRGRVALALIAAVAAVAMFGATDLFDDNSPDVQSSSDGARRAAYRERSMLALRAVDVSEHARALLFPLFDVRQQEIALDMFRHSISLDPNLHHGYAGAAQVLATLAFNSPSGDAASEFQLEASLMASKALELAPSDGWVQAANSWVLAVSGSPDEAMSFSRRASQLAPAESHVLDLAAITAILSDSPQFAAELSEVSRNMSGEPRFAANNIWGVSQLMLGNYDEVIKAFTLAPELGAPVAAPTLIFLAVAHDQVGNEAEASRVVAELRETWPDFPTNRIIAVSFQNSPEIKNDILKRLSKYNYP